MAAGSESLKLTGGFLAKPSGERLEIPFERERAVRPERDRSTRRPHEADDAIVPRASIEALHAAAPTGAQIYMISGGHVRPNADQLITELVGRLIAWSGTLGSELMFSVREPWPWLVAAPKEKVRGPEKIS